MNLVASESEVLAPLASGWFLEPSASVAGDRFCVDHLDRQTPANERQ
ncbi:MAG: hypothetical protein RLZZ534_312 [Actinomycetota bacterium]